MGMNFWHEKTKQIKQFKYFFFSWQVTKKHNILKERVSYECNNIFTKKFFFSFKWSDERLSTWLS